MVGQRDFARLRDGAAADHAGVADRVVRRAERPRRQQRLARPAAGPRRCRCASSPGSRPASAAAGSSAAAGPASSCPVPGEPIIRTLWPPAAATTSGPLGELLAADVGEVDVVAVQLRGSISSMPRRRPARPRPPRRGCRPPRPATRRRRPRAPRRRPPRGRSRAGRAAASRPRSRAAIAIDSAPLTGRTAPSRASSPTRGEVGELLGQELPGGDEQPERDGQVERPGVLPQVGRGEVDDRAAGRPGVAEVGEGPLDAVDALADGQLGQADEDGLGRARRRRRPRPRPGRRRCRPGRRCCSLASMGASSG